MFKQYSLLVMLLTGLSSSACFMPATLGDIADKEAVHFAMDELPHAGSITHVLLDNGAQQVSEKYPVVNAAAGLFMWYLGSMIEVISYMNEIEK
jgi:hypothetical protein